MIYVWECDRCNATLEINYDATEADYNRFKKCGCKQDGTFVWKRNRDGQSVFVTDFTGNERW